ncbi:MAG: hypothetical protein HY782_15860 [Chloroflexi bacterium]|nr:hypothetical protein [Chloroflexota bacterium]
MSRSFRRHPVFGITTARSEKCDKQLANRRFRHAWKQGHDVVHIREVSDPWSFAKDGKKYWRATGSVDMAK